MKLSRPVIIFLLIILCFAGFYTGAVQKGASFEPEAVYPEETIHIPATASTPESPLIHASYACVMDSSSRRILYEKGGNEKVPMASTTKIMTAILVLESGRTEETVTASPLACRMPKVHLGMQKGEQFLMSDLLYSLMLESHNDTAVAIAEHMAGSVEAFAGQMNEKAKKLGMKNTHFVTPNGLDANTDDHYSTASDMCILASYAVKNEAFLQLVQTKSYSFSNLRGTRTFSLSNHDAFLSYYDGALGIKTGFTNKAGYCFVGAAKRGDTVLTSCVLAAGWPPNKSYKWMDTKELMNYGYTHFTRSELPLQDLTLAKIPVEDGKKSRVSLQQPKKIQTLLGRFDTITVVYDYPKKLCAPIKKDTAVGTVSYYINDTLFHKETVFPSEDIEKSDFSDTIEFVFHLWTEQLF